MKEIKTIVMKPNSPVFLNNPDVAYPEACIELEGNGNCVVLLLYTDNGGTLFVNSGDSVFASAPLAISLTPTVYTVVQLETGRYMHQNGEHKGKILLETDIDDLNCTCIEIN